MDRKWWTLIAVCVGTFMLLLDVTIVNVALPAIQTSLKASFSDLQWVVDAYALMLAALLLTTGSLADLFGRRRVFVIGLIIFSASSLLSGLASDPLWLNLARGAQGVGGAAMFSTSLALLGTAFQGRERGTAFGVWGAITGLAVAIGPVVGGALTTGISWRWIFLVNVPIGVIAVVLCLARVDESRQQGARRPDLIGVVTFSGALGALVYALIKADAKGWGSPVILACLGGAAALLVLFLIAESVQKSPMFDLALFRKPTFTGGSIAAFALSAGLFALLLYLTLYLQDVLRYSAMQTGLRLLVLSGGILLTSTLAGRLTAHVPIRFLIAPGLLLVGIGLLLMRGLTASSGWTHLIPGFIVAGAGTGLINPPLASTAIGVVTPDRAGMASGINSTFRQVGIATGIAGLGTLFSHTVRTHIVSLLAGRHGVSAQAAGHLANSVAQGSGAGSGLRGIPAAGRATAVHAIRAGFTTGLNQVFLVGAILAGVSAVLTLLLIRSQDFEAGSARTPSRPAGAPAAAEVPAAAEAAAVAEAPAVAEEGGRSSLSNHENRPPSGDGATNAGETAPTVAAPTVERRTPPAPLADDSPQDSTGPDQAPAHAAIERMIETAEAARADHAREIDRQIGQFRADEVAAARVESRRLLQAALDRTDAFASRLRRRAAELSDELERVVADARFQAEASAAGHGHDGDSDRDPALLAEVRHRIYRLIGAYAAGPDEARPAASGAPANPAAANGAPANGIPANGSPSTNGGAEPVAHTAPGRPDPGQ